MECRAPPLESEAPVRAPSRGASRTCASSSPARIAAWHSWRSALAERASDHQGTAAKPGPPDKGRAGEGRAVLPELRWSEAEWSIRRANVHGAGIRPSNARLAAAQRLNHFDDREAPVRTGRL